MELGERPSLWTPRAWRASIQRMCLSVKLMDDLHIALHAASSRRIGHTIVVKSSDV